MPAKSGQREGKVQEPHESVNTSTNRIQLDTATATSIAPSHAQSQSRPHPHPYRPHRDGSGSIGSALEWTSPSLIPFHSPPSVPERQRNFPAHRSSPKTKVSLVLPPTFLSLPPPSLPERKVLFWRSTRKASNVEEFIEPREIRKQHEKRNSFGAQSTPLYGG